MIVVVVAQLLIGWLSVGQLFSWLIYPFIQSLTHALTHSLALSLTQYRTKRANKLPLPWSRQPRRLPFRGDAVLILLLASVLVPFLSSVLRCYQRYLVGN